MKFALYVTQGFCILSAILMLIVTGHHIGHQADKHYEMMHHVSNFVQALNWIWIYYMLSYKNKNHDY